MPAGLAKIQSRPDYVDEVYRILLDAISDGSLAPGTRLTQEEIAEQLEVSRYPVLHALRLLKKDGFVKDAPGRGVLVAPLDAEWTAKLYEIRGALDSLAARLAARHRYKFDPGVLEAGQAAVESQDVKAMIEADMAFHSAIYSASQNPLISATAQTHWVHLRRVMGAVLQSSHLRMSILAEHGAIARAIAEGDGEEAARQSMLHTEQASAFLVARLGEVLKPPALLE